MFYSGLREFLLYCGVEETRHRIEVAYRKHNDVKTLAVLVFEIGYGGVEGYGFFAESRRRERADVVEIILIRKRVALFRELPVER